MLFIGASDARASLLAAGGGGGESEAAAAALKPELEWVFFGVMLVAFFASCAAIWRLRLLRADGLELPKRDPGGFDPSVWGALALGLLLVQALGAAFASGLAGLSPGQVPGLGHLAIVNAGAYVPAIVVIGAVAFGRRDISKRAGVRFGVRDAMVGSLGFLLIYPVVWATMTLAGFLADAIGETPRSPVAHETLRLLIDQAWTAGFWEMTALVVVVAPLVEEFIYRVCVQSALVKLLGTRWRAIVVTSLLFTLMHIGVAEPPALAGLFVLSLGLGFAFERTGRIGVSVVMHSLFNALNIVVAVALVPPPV